MKVQKITANQEKQIRELFEKGYSGRKIAYQIGLSKSAVNRFLSKSNLRTARKPRILFLDLENAPSVVAAFQRWDVNISQDHVIEEGGWLISACWKFLGEDKVSYCLVTPEEARNRDDSRVVASLYEAVEQADVVIAHNLKKFDWPLFKTRLLMNGFPPPPTVKLVDTLRIAKSLKFNSNKLDSLGEVLEIGRKKQNAGITLWLECMEGKTGSLLDMLEYNEEDVELLERLYLKIRAWDGTAPNLAMYKDDTLHRCPICTSSDVYKTGNVVYTAASAFEEVQCGHCGHRSKIKGNLLSKEKRNSLISTAK